MWLPPPRKGSPKRDLTKVEMVMTKRTLIRYQRVWPKSVRLSIQPYQKVGTNISKREEKGRILNCIVSKPKGCLYNQLNALRLLRSFPNGEEHSCVHKFKSYYKT